MTDPKRPAPKKPICGNCGRERLKPSISVVDGTDEDGNEVTRQIKPSGNVGICPECYHADAMDWDEAFGPEPDSPPESD